MMKKLSIFSLALILAILMILPTASIAEPAVVEPISEAFEYDYEEFPLERNGIELHLDRVKVEGTEPERNILLVHGLTYSSHEFDINYEDYSLVRLLARDGYAVCAWTLRAMDVPARWKMASCPIPTMPARISTRRWKRSWRRPA